jgi:hypothetical protein
MATTTYVRHIIDSFGVWKYGLGGEIDPRGGYTLADAALGLITCIVIDDRKRAKVCLNFILTAQTDKGFTGAYDAQRQPSEKRALPEAHALAMWALAFAVSHDFKPEKANAAFERGLAHAPLDAPQARATAYLLLAFSELGERGAEMAEGLATRLQSQFSAPWQWFGPKLTTAAATLPYALIRYQQTFGNEKKLQKIVKKSLETLDTCMRIGSIPAPVGGRTGQTIGSPLRNVYDQAAVDAGWMVLLWLAAAGYSNDASYRTRAETWLDWFHGNNIYRRALVTTQGACADGLVEPGADDHGVSVRYSAQSTMMYVLAHTSYT